MMKFSIHVVGAGDMYNEIYGGIKDLTPYFMNNKTKELLIDRSALAVDDYLAIGALAAESSSQVIFRYKNTKSTFIESNSLYLKKSVLINGLKKDAISRDDITQRCSYEVFVAHGEGSHLKLNEFVLCSCTDFGDDCIKCRKNKSGIPIKISELNSKNLILLSCNSATFSNELYPSSNNLLFAGLAKMCYVIAAVTPVEIIDEYEKFILSAIDAGWDCPLITMGLNKLYMLHQQEAPFICCTSENTFLPLSCNQEKIVKRIPVSEKSSISIIPEKEILHLYRFSDEVISFARHSVRFTYSNFNTINHQLSRLQLYNNFIFSYISCLVAQNKGQRNNLHAIYAINRKLSYSIFQIKIKINDVQRIKIISDTALKKLIKKVDTLVQISRSLLRYLINLKTFGETLEFYTRRVRQIQISNLDEQRCSRCHSVLRVGTGAVVDGEPSLLLRSCPICGIYSIQVGQADFVSHSYSFISSNLAKFEIISDIYDYYYLTVWDKTVDKLAVKKEGVLDSRVNIYTDVAALEPDVHTYKVILIGDEGLGYLHGKFIKE